jgi:hypothetical protein
MEWERSTGGGSTLGAVVAVCEVFGPLVTLQPERLGIPDGCHSQSLTHSGEALAYGV